MNTDIIFVIYPIVNASKEYKEYLWTSSSLVLRKFIRLTNIESDQIHKMTYEVFKKFRNSIIDEHTDIFELIDYGDFAAPEGYDDFLSNSVDDIIFDISNSLRSVENDLKYFKDTDSIKLKNHIHKYLKKIRKINLNDFTNVKCKKIVKDYYKESGGYHW